MIEALDWLNRGRSARPWNKKESVAGHIPPGSEVVAAPEPRRGRQSVRSMGLNTPGSVRVQRGGRLGQSSPLARWDGSGNGGWRRCEGRQSAGGKVLGSEVGPPLTWAGRTVGFPPAFNHMNKVFQKVVGPVLGSAILLSLAGCTSESPTSPPMTKVVMVPSTHVPSTPVPEVAPAPIPEAQPVVASVTNAMPVTEGTASADVPTAEVPPQRPPLPAGAAGVADLAQAGVGESVMLEYVRTSTNSFALDADQIVYLKDIGVPDAVLTAMVQKQGQSQSQSVEAKTEAVAAAPAPAAESAAPAETAAAATETPAPPVYAASAAPAMASEPAPVYSTPVTAVSDSYFYGALTPYGSWVELPTYGWCWRPTIAVADPFWRPYLHGGQWVYTDAGWYWQSNYSWGWAAFHYGNWHRSPRCGWVWVPGSVWAPAWVTWRYTDAYCGWAPLPPGCGWSTGVGLTYWGSGVGVSFGFGLGFEHYSFVHYRHLCDRAPHRHHLNHRQGENIFRSSTVMNNYAAGHGHAVVNGGLAPSRVTRVTREEVRKVQMQDVTGQPDAPRRADRLAQDGRTLAVYRPQPTAGTPGQPGSVSQPRSRHTQEVQRGSVSSPAPVAGGRATVAAPVRSSGRVNSAPSGSQPSRSSTPIQRSEGRGTSRAVTSTPTPASPARVPSANTSSAPATRSVSPGTSSRGQAVPRATQSTTPRSSTQTTPSAPAQSRPAAPRSSSVYNSRGGTVTASPSRSVSPTVTQTTRPSSSAALSRSVTPLYSGSSSSSSPRSSAVSPSTTPSVSYRSKSGGSSAPAVSAPRSSPSAPAASPSRSSSGAAASGGSRESGRSRSK